MKRIKDYIVITHKMPLILDDVNQDDDELKFMKQRPTASYKVENKGLDSFERSFDEIYNFDTDLKNNTAIRGPQGRKGIYDSIKFDSIWEYAYYRWSKELHGNVIERNRTEYFVYYDETNKKRKFFYDFLENGLPVEVKGILRPSDACKQDQCPQVRFVFGDEVKQIMKELDQKCKGWRNDYVEVV